MVESIVTMDISSELDELGIDGAIGSLIPKSPAL
jgi:hypothetical protein